MKSAKKSAARKAGEDGFCVQVGPGRARTGSRVVPHFCSRLAAVAFLLHQIMSACIVAYELHDGIMISIAK